MRTTNPVHFSSGEKFRIWLAANHTSVRELSVGIFSKASGKGGITYSEALDEALCFGWIDGVRRKVDSTSYSIRFTPRKPRSTWSLVNVRHARRLISLGRMDPAGQKAFEAREKGRTGIYSFENRPKTLPAGLGKVFQANKKAWAYWKIQPPGYRRTAIWWVVSAVRETTRMSRLKRLIGTSAAGRRLDFMA